MLHYVCVLYKYLIIKKQQQQEVYINISQKLVILKEKKIVWEDRQKINFLTSGKIKQQHQY